MTRRKRLVVLPDTMTDRETYRRKARIIKAMGHPGRLMMIDALVEGEKCVCELQEIVGSDMSTASEHLSVLRNAGLVNNRKQGLNVFYSLRVPCIVNFFGCVEAVMDQPPETAETCSLVK